MKLDTKKGALVLVGALALAVIVISAVLQGGRQGGGGQLAPTGPAPSYAPKGELVAGFPKELILDDAARVSNSYLINYSSSLNQYTAQWSSSSSMATLYASYQGYFAKNGWTVVSKFTSSPNLRGIYVRKGSHDANVAIVPQGKGSQVTVSYVAK